MSKTSSRQARKRRQELRALRWENLNAVPYEAHARLRDELERVSAVLADLIEEQKGAAVPARQVVAWVKNPEDVRAVFDASADFYDCPECDVSRSSAHLRTCAIARAWYRTGHHHHLRDLENAHHEALVENNRRTVGLKQPLFPNRRNSVRITGLFDRPPNTDQLRGYRDRQLMVNPRDLGQTEVVLADGGIQRFDGIEVVTSDLVRPGEAYLMNPADFALPLPPATLEHGFGYSAGPAEVRPFEGRVFASSADPGRGQIRRVTRQDLAAEFPPPVNTRTLAGRMYAAEEMLGVAELGPAEYLRIVGTPPASENWRREYLGVFPEADWRRQSEPGGPDYERWVSDNRGLDVVEAEARAHHIDLMLNRIGFPGASR